MNNDTENRYLWTNARGILVILLVIGHLIEAISGKMPKTNYIWLIIHSFLYPAFLMIDGYLAKNNKDHLKQAMKYGLIYLAIQVATHTMLFALNESNPWSGFIVQPIKATWYFLFLMYIYLLLYVCTKFKLNVNKWFLLIMSIGIGVIVGFVPQIGNKFGILRFGSFLFYFLFGYLFDLNEIINKAKSKKVLMFFGLIAFEVILCALMYEGIVDRKILNGVTTYDSLSIKNVSLGVIERLVSYPISLFLGISFLSLLDSKKGLFYFIGRDYLYVYAVHVMLISRIYNYFEKIIKYDNRYLNALVILICVTAVLSLCTIVIFFVVEILLNTIKKKRYGEAYDNDGSLLIKSAQNALKRFHKHAFLFEELVKRDFKEKYKRTTLGMLWSVLSPLLQLFVMEMVFTRLFGKDTPFFSVYMCAGVVVMSYYRDSTRQGMASLVKNSSIITKINVPKYLFLFSRIVSSFVNFCLTIVIFFIYCLIHKVPFGLHMLTIIYPIITLTLMNIGVGMILSVLYIFFRDTSYLYSVFLTLLNYVSAIFYDVKRFGGNAEKLFLMNPVYVHIKYFRMISIESTIPGLGLHILLMSYALVSLMIGFYLYKRYNHRFVYYI